MIRKVVRAEVEEFDESIKVNSQLSKGRESSFKFIENKESMKYSMNLMKKINYSI